MKKTSKPGTLCSSLKKIRNEHCKVLDLRDAVFILRVGTLCLRDPVSQETLHRRGPCVREKTFGDSAFLYQNNYISVMIVLQDGNHEYSF